MVIELLIYDVILGCDFLEFYKVKIDLEDYKFFFYNDFLVLNSFVEVVEVMEEIVCGIYV